MAGPTGLSLAVPLVHLPDLDRQQEQRDEAGDHVYQSPESSASGKGASDLDGFAAQVEAADRFAA